jgi:phage repressor protein C with HTH and peptisase S24 domain
MTPMTMNKEIARRLRRAREAAGFRTATEFAERFRIPQSTYALHETGARGLKPAIAERYGKLLAVSAGWLLTGGGDAPAAKTGPARPGSASAPPSREAFRTNGRDLPVLGTAQGGPNGNLIIPVEQHAVDYAYRPPQLEGVADAFAVFAREDSMSPMYRNGQVLFVHPHLPVRPGDGILIVKQDDHALVKCLVRRTQTELRVRQYNPGREFTIAAGDVRAIYRVVGAMDPI